MIGKTLLHFKILDKLGSGGMGDVYLAKDQNLGRKVALKVLPEKYFDNPDARERFQREARAASALNHPHICTIHEIGEHDGQPFIVMEYLKGRTLKETIQSGSLPAEDLFKIGVQLADGLSAAHAEGIFHRDIKPANIFINERGDAKVLDFGLAKLRQPDSASSMDSEAATLQKSDLTRPGSALGTVAYMSPEQILGKPIDTRTDVFSLGIVLYEIATGTAPFRGDTSGAVFDEILHRAPTPPARLNPELPAELEQIINRCLEKDPTDWYQSAELRDGLNECLQALSAERARIRPALHRWKRKPRVWVTILIVALASIGGAAWFLSQRQKVQWAREVALPEIERLADAMSWAGEGTYAWSAYGLALEAQQAIPDDRLLSELWPDFSREVKIDSDPTGIKVYAKPYAAPESEWRFLGTTPVGPIRFPLGFSRLKLEKDGFRPVFDLVWNYSMVTDEWLNKWLYKLHEEGSLPEEMVYFPGGAVPLQIPGLDHLSVEPVGRFLMDRYEVTNKEFKRFVDNGGYARKDLWRNPFILDGRTVSWEEATAHFKDRTGRPGPSTWEVGDYPKGEDDYPVSGVSWYEAAAYAEFAGKSLPTIFHWNQAAFTWGTAEILPFCNLDGRGPTRVGSRPCMHREGTHDLAGNVREWSWNATRFGDERFILGGGWNDPPYAFTDAYAQSPFDRSPTNGFRCIRFLETEENLHSLTREIEVPFRDFFKEKPVSDDVFQIFLNQYNYDRTDLDAMIEEEKDEEEWVRQKISFDAAYGGERMFAYLFLPKKVMPPYQTVVIFPGSGAIHNRDFSDYRGGDFFLKSGRAVLLPIYKGTYERGDELDSDYPNETSFYKEHVIMWVKDFSRSIDYLETREDIDTDKLAFYGASWGGFMGNIVPAVEKRLKAAVLYIGGLYFQKALPEVDALNYVTRVTLPVLLLNGENDFFFPLETSQRPMFELLGTPEKDKKWLVYPGAHSVPRTDSVKETLDWLDSLFGTR